MKIRTKLIATFVVAVTIPVAILAMFSIREVTNEAIEQFQKATSKEIIQVDRAFNIFFDNAKKNIDYLSSIPEVTEHLIGAPSFVDQQKIDSFKGWSSLEGQSKRLFEIFERFGKSQKNLAYVYTGRETGSYVEWPGSNFSSPFDPRVRPWYKAAMAADGKPVMTNAYYWKGDDATYIAIAKVVKNATNEVLGAVSLDVSVNELTDIVKNITIGENGYIVLLEDNDNILVDPYKPENSFKSISDVNTPFFKLMSEHPMGLFEVSRGGTDYLGQIITSKLGWRFVALVPKSEVYAAAVKQTYVTFAIVIPLVVIFILIAFYVSKVITSQISSVTGVLQQISQGHGDLTIKLDASAKDEVGDLSRAFNGFVDKLGNLIREVVSLSSELKDMAEVATEKAHKWQTDSGKQLEKVTLVTEAISEMSKATAEIASSSEQAAGVAESGSTACNDGKMVVESTRESIETLAGEVHTTNDIISKLNDNSQQITTIITTIQGIAEQTNLLALNAAIEAARAGEHGRGFAVVADEVRNLSQKTTASTEEIQQMIQELQQTTQQAANVMKNSKSMTDSAVEQANTASESLVQLARSIDQIKGASIQIATATEEQSCVCDDITLNTQQINDIANQLTEEAQGQLQSAEEFRIVSDKMFDLVGKFKV
ncbi:methyl-accepting chemotaxis protein [Vibrio mangrovi]|uniref:Methyl-accepting chemotaxis protein n=1 Tax=Vibrio mangrovi TaxID=474394 RepID=A0A1Y6IVJ4_9VIBR|nr:methyl-accepting chemotaxis protein [Vibrio mangrovi]MDW6002289.1 methyl-accepting chemotaxis protein [Vibrio mangrovi]SMS01636.1 Methyl-accepting chemotaxis protein PctB [Vibrio mangrovi]